MSICASDSSRCLDLRHDQRAIVEAWLRTDRVWRRVDKTEAGSVEHYVAVHGSWHIGGALGGGAEDGTLAAQLVETPEGLAEALAIAVGTARMEAFASSAQRGGDLLLASRFWHAASLPAARGHITSATELALLTSATGALRAMDQDPAANAAEITMLGRMRSLLIGKPSELNKVVDRLEELLELAKSRGEESWQLAVLDATVCVAKAVKSLQVFSGQIKDISEFTEERRLQASELYIRSARAYLRAIRLGHPEAERHMLMWSSFSLGVYWGVCARDFVAARLLEELGAPESWVSATALYDPRHPWRENPYQWDPYLVNQHMHVLLHHYGCIAHAVASVHKIAQAAAHIPQVLYGAPPVPTVPPLAPPEKNHI